MARKQVGRVPALADDAVDKQWVQDILTAPSVIPVSRLQATGPKTAYTVLYGDGHWGVTLGNFIVAEPRENYTLRLPSSPVDGELVMVEVRPLATGPIVVTIPEQVRLTSGTGRSYELLPEKSFILGLRWSDRATAWHLLAATHEI
jgi:hypothetical protein